MMIEYNVRNVTQIEREAILDFLHDYEDDAVKNLYLGDSMVQLPLTLVLAKHFASLTKLINGVWFSNDLNGLVKYLLDDETSESNDARIELENSQVLAKIFITIADRISFENLRKTFLHNYFEKKGKVLHTNPASQRK